jgi:hypothetical protein
MLILKFNSSPCSYFSFSAKVVLLKVVHPLKMYQNTKLHGPMLSDASFASPQKFERLPLWNAYS